MISRANHTRLLVLFIASICSCADEFSFGNEMNCAAEGKSGICIIVSDCEYAVDIIERSGISSTKSLNFLMSNNCGFEGETPKICCPEEKSMHNRHAFKPEESQSSDEENDNFEKPGGENPFSLLPKACGIQILSRIIGGTEAESGDFPWLVALEYDDGTEEPIIGCGGTLITQRYVLTAAHCVLTTSNLRLTKVRLGEQNIVKTRDSVDKSNGETDRTDPVLSVAIESKIVHENVRSPNYYSNDIALLRLTDDVPVTSFIQPICLPSTSDTGEIYWSAGWGQSETRRHSDVKLKIELPYFDFDQCVKKYRSKNIILGKGQMCAGGQAAKDTCKGDSGGPLMRQVEIAAGNDLRWVIDGVLSLGTDYCGLAKWPAVYTKVHDYLPWILSKLRS